MNLRAPGLALALLTFGACSTPTVNGPDKHTGAAHTGDTQELVQDSDTLRETGPVETGWPVVSGEDLALVDADAKTLSLIFNEEQQFGAPGATWTIPIADATVLLCDFNGDGLDDAWVLNSGTDDLKIDVYPNTGSGFSSTSSYSVKPGFNAVNYSYACGDTRGTGHADFLAFKNGADKLFLYPNTGTAIDTTNVVKTTVDYDTGATWLVADFDDDDKDELGVLTGGTLEIYRMTDGKPETASPMITVAISGSYGVTTLDLDADDHADIGLWNGSAFVVWPGTGSGFDTANATAFIIDGTGSLVGGNLR